MGDKKVYSQSSEQLFIEDYFLGKETGNFLDIGAYDVYRFSNVRALYERGWGGILVEPQPVNFHAIKEHYKDDPKIEVLNFAVGEPAGEIDFYESDGDAVGTTDYQHMEKWSKGGVKFTKIKVPQVGVVDFFNQYCKDVDFLSIDTEATNVAVFRNIPDFVWGQIKMICIEHDHHQQEIEEKLTPYGFTTLYVNGENIILAKL
jgi:FkbM family methyltransferase